MDDQGVDKGDTMMMTTGRVNEMNIYTVLLKRESKRVRE